MMLCIHVRNISYISYIFDISVAINLAVLICIGDNRCHALPVLYAIGRFISLVCIGYQIYVEAVILLYRFQALRNRARKARANRKPNLGDIKPGSIIENIAHTRR